MSVLIALLFAGSASRATSAPVDLIRNGSFEQNAADGTVPVGWTAITNSHGAWSGKSAGPTSAKRGAWMLHPGAGYESGGAFQDVRTFAGQRYRLSFWAVGFAAGKGRVTPAETQRGRVQVGAPGSDDHDLAAENRADLVDVVFEVSRYAGVDDWRRLNFEFAAAADTTRVTFENIGLGAGLNAVNVDDVRLEPIGALVPAYGRALRGLEEEQRQRAERQDRLQSCRPRIVFVKRHHFRPPGAGGVLLCWDAFAPGGGIYTFDPRDPDAGERQIFDSSSGVVFDLSLSHDANKVAFAWLDLSAQGKDSFHIYEMQVDGTDLRQLTHGRFHDVSPVYLPDGDICFVSTRAGSFSMCQDAPASALHVMEPDGADIRRIQFGTLADFSPHVLDDGSILFTRWEYQDKSVFSVQSLWSIRPDGTRLQLVYGNTITIPNTIWQAKPIPGTDRLLCTLAPHHRNLVGAIGVLDPGIGKEDPAALINLTPEIPYAPTTHPDWRPGDRLYYWSYRDPYPIEDDLFLVSYGGEEPHRYRLYLMNDRGEKARFLEDDTFSCFNAIPVAPRRVPHQVASPRSGSESDPFGTFLLVDVYAGLEEYGIRRGDVKALRVMTQVRRPTNNRGARAYFHGHDIVDPVIGAGTFYVKYVCGTVPVYEDGSAHFRAPANTELYFQALDAAGKELARMGTFTQLVPGERQSCIGCHESRNTAPPGGRDVPSAAQRPPDDITPPPWGAGPVDFARQVQPALDRYCASCHGGVDPDAGIDLSGDKTRHFNMAYDTLAARNLVQFYYLTPPQELTGRFVPGTSGSRVSRIVELIESGHGDVDMDPESRRRLYVWIEANIPYYGTYEHTRPGTAGSRDAWVGPWIDQLTQRFNSRCSGCHGQLDRGHNRHSTWVNLTHPEFSRLLNAPLAKSAGGLELCREKAGKQPVRFRDKDDPDYSAMLEWIAAGKERLEARPRMDMAGAIAAPYEQDFGRLYRGGGK